MNGGLRIELQPQPCLYLLWCSSISLNGPLGVRLETCLPQPPSGSDDELSSSPTTPSFQPSFQFRPHPQAPSTLTLPPSSPGGPGCPTGPKSPWRRDRQTGSQRGDETRGGDPRGDGRAHTHPLALLSGQPWEAVEAPVALSEETPAGLSPRPCRPPRPAPALRPPWVLCLRGAPEPRLLQSGPGGQGGSQGKKPRRLGHTCHRPTKASRTQSHALLRTESRSSLRPE